MSTFGSLQTASEVKSDLLFQICDPNYLLIHVHIAYDMAPFVNLRGHYNLVGQI